MQLENADRHAAMQVGDKEPPNVWKQNDLYDGAVETANENTYEHFDEDIMSAEYYDDNEAYNINAREYNSTPYIDSAEVTNIITAARFAANHAENRARTSNGSIAPSESSKSRGNSEISVVSANTRTNGNARPNDSVNDREPKGVTLNSSRDYEGINSARINNINTVTNTHSYPNKNTHQYTYTFYYSRSRDAVLRAYSTS